MVKTLVTGSLRRSAIGSLRPWNERVRIEREREREIMPKYPFS